MRSTSGVGGKSKLFYITATITSYYTEYTVLLTVYFPSIVYGAGSGSRYWFVAEKLIEMATVSNHILAGTCGAPWLTPASSSWTSKQLHHWA